ncbi:protein SHQ1 homolog [Sinocyclocheilus grahami]|uniref:Protein SHQ1 homolog n=1 Tax=Sinocyclocheilus grahami TaxID=75366 RepID=A0A672QIY7_SINGR|nr:PREDICTED: protein SHQ1 homolog [Sinocyclocheilus grahami]
MITPAFELSQDADFLTVVIRVPYTRTSAFDIYIQGEDLKFYAKPYFLRLTLPGRIVEDGREKASFDIAKGLFTLHVPKETAGQHFEGLEMLTSLLAPKGSRSAKPLVEDTGKEYSVGVLSEACGGGCEEEDEEEEFDWQIEQEVYTETPAETLKEYHKYGFGNLRSGVFTRLQEELNEVIDVKDPDNTAPELRRRTRLDAETTIFCADHYLVNLYEDEEEIRNLLKFKPWWRELSPDPSTHSDTSITFTEEEKEQMRKFTNHSYLLDKKARFHAWLGLVDIVLAYVYDVRTTEGEHSVESAWTIRKLSGTLSWLETYHSVEDVLVSFGRRTLCYPLYRHFSLITRAVKDVACIFQSGKACVLKCLLAIHKIFRENDPAYILNDLYITDYCIWIQRVKSKHVLALAESLHNAKLQKNHLDLELEILEQAAELAMKEEEEEEEEEEEGDSSSGSDSEDEEESEEKQPEETQPEERTENNQTGLRPFEPQVSCEVLKVDAVTEASLLRVELQPGGGEPRQPRRLIEELGERLEAGLTIQEDVPRERHSISGSNTEGERKSEGDYYHQCAAETERDATKAATSSELLDPCLQRNPLRIISNDELDSDDDGDLLLTVGKEGP